MEQRHAAAADAERAYIVAAPGSGKTTVAAERYGVIRYGRNRDPRRVLGLSFTRSARNELSSRIISRWGVGTLGWHHRVLTFDGMHLELLTHMLRSGTIRWPNGRSELTVLDTWRGQPGSHYMTKSLQYRRVATLNGSDVTSTGGSIGQPVYGIGKRETFDRYLADGVCTHEEVRQLIGHAVRESALRRTLSNYLAATVRAIVIDEVFDANRLDLRVIELAIDAGIATTLIGDPWQALYYFRGARPDLVPQLVREREFQSFPVNQSFRFETSEMQGLASRLREGRPVHLERGSVDGLAVVLASQWDELWGAPEEVLPVSFGKIDNQTDAAVVIMLDRLVNAHFGHNAIYGTEAITLLGLDPDVVRAEGPAVLDSVLETLRVGTASAAADAIQQLRASLRALGSPRRLSSLPSSRETAQLARLQALARRMKLQRPMPGMTVHQAKGREWPVVGVRLTEPQVERLAGGLSEHSADDRLLYVALTRARRAVRLV